MADVRAAMSRNDDFDPIPETYAGGEAVFEVSAILEALTIEDEVLV